MESPSPKKPKKVSSSENVSKSKETQQKPKAKKQDWEEHFELLNDEQKKAFQMAVEGKSIFIAGAAGTGKSFLLSAMIKYWKTKQGHQFAITASTGIAATNLSAMLGFGSFQGTTIHSWSGLGASKEYRTINQDIDKISKNKGARENWFSIQTLIIEEISMISPFFFQRLEELARTFRDKDKPFGGIQIIACGDWNQLEPVRKDDPPEYSDMKYCFKTEAWEKVIGKNVIELYQIYRQKDVEFLILLNEIRQGFLSPKSKEILQSRVVEKKVWLERTDDTIGLYPRVQQVLEENGSQLEKIKEKEHIFHPRWVKKNINDVEKRYIMKKMFETFSFDKEPLKLKKGAKVILTVNLSVGLGLVNGLQGTVVDFGTWDIGNNQDSIINPEMQDIFPIVEFQNGMQLTVARYIWFEHADVDPKDRHHWDSKLCKALGYSQIPLKLGFASSIHSAQGMGFSKIGLDLGRKIFGAGQAYTGISRCTSLEGLTLIDFHSNCIITNQEVLDFYEEYGNTEKRKAYYDNLIKQHEAELEKREKEQQSLNVNNNTSSEGKTESTEPTKPMSVSKALKIALDSKKRKQDDQSLFDQKAFFSSSMPQVKSRPF